MKIAFRHAPFDDKQKKALDELAAGKGHETLWLPDSLPTAEDVKDCEVLMGYFPAGILKDLPNLRWLQTPCAGVERFCGDIYAREDVILTNSSGAFGVAIAEYMFTGLLMLMRLMPSYAANQKEHVWNCEGNCRSIFGSTITVVGMGDIGTNFAERAKAFGAVVRGVRRTDAPSPSCYDEVYTTDKLSEALKNVDAVVLALPGTKETTKVINREVIAAMDEKTIVVNCGRGYTVDQAALKDALKEGKLAGAVLDVFEAEPLPSDDELWDMKNVIITPHISGHDDDPVNSSIIYSIFYNNLKHYILGEPLEHIVDQKAGY